MRIQFYRPNSSSTGCGFSFNFAKELRGGPAVMVNAIQQYSWNSQKKIADFKTNKDNPEKTAVVKLNSHEVAEIASVLETSPILFGNGIRENFPMKFQAYHSNGDNSTLISFYPMVRNKSVFSGGKRLAIPDIHYSFSISQNQTKKFSILLSHGEGRDLLEFLKVSLQNSYGPIDDPTKTN